MRNTDNNNHYVTKDSELLSANHFTFSDMLPENRLSQQCNKQDGELLYPSVEKPTEKS